MQTSPVLETATDTLGWLREQPDSRREELSTGLSTEPESEFLESLANA